MTASGHSPTHRRYAARPSSWSWPSHPCFLRLECQLSLVNPDPPLKAQLKESPPSTHLCLSSLGLPRLPVGSGSTWCPVGAAGRPQTGIQRKLRMTSPGERGGGRGDGGTPAGGSVASRLSFQGGRERAGTGKLTEG